MGFVQAQPHQRPAIAVLLIEIQAYSLVVFGRGGNVRKSRRVRFELLDYTIAQRFEIAPLHKRRTVFRRFFGFREGPK